ncbi:Magnetosome protein MamH (MamH protein, major facilitator superfamily) [Candidatus Terasakiella magnetica]|uniref:Magnetosome protein MamH (MamH protein, major facilitator superfamily) n=1 Tax=Candidatus Terasakiella magnetica TaxID=1867952 RepID=A0A1C3RFR4_9PROT|nr:magnetosome biogenesis transporter MamH [Candidatus Terasakiella magnetica]SCA56095.1 Magnetosome protein MamH (MamH protein, major facilitator superfamily) [Candidatus Terasakiella magnetica]
MSDQSFEREHRNALYFLAAISMVFMTLAIAVQPLFLRNVLDISFESAGAVNASVQVVTEVLDLALIFYLGYLSDRFGRVPIATIGFLVAAFGALLAPLSLELGAFFGIGGLAFYYVMRIIMSLGTGAVWPQISALAGDSTDFDSRPRFMANMAFMMALGGTLVYAILMQMPKYTGYIVVMVLTAGVGLIGAYVSHRCLVDIAPKLEKKEFPWARIKELLKKDDRLRLSFASAFFARADMVFIGLFLMMWFIYFADLIKVEQEVAAAEAGSLIGLVGIVVLVSLPAWGRAIEVMGRVKTLALGMALSGTGFVGLGFIVNPFDWEIVPFLVLAALGQAGCLVAPQVLTIDLTPKDIRGSMLGMFNVVGGIGIVVFVQIGGFLFDHIGPHAPFVLIGVANFAVVTYSLWVLRGDGTDEQISEDICDDIEKVFEQN